MSKRYIPNDAWSRKAAAEGYRARSVYKLIEMDEKFRLLRPGMHILDIGACPGSWLQYASKCIGPRGSAVGIDLNPIEPIAENVSLFVQDVTDIDGMEKLVAAQGIERFDLILSDLAPKTSGMRDVDQWRSIELSHMVIEASKRWLKPGGTCVMKVLRGEDFDEFYRDLKSEWQHVSTFSAKASRDRSREAYVLIRGEKNTATEEQEAIR